MLARLSGAGTSPAVIPILGTVKDSLTVQPVSLPYKFVPDVGTIVPVLGYAEPQNGYVHILPIN